MHNIEQMKRTRAVIFNRVFNHPFLALINAMKIMNALKLNQQCCMYMRMSLQEVQKHCVQ